MRNLRIVLALGWAILGIALLIAGVMDWLSWQHEPVLSKSSLQWWSSTAIIPGAIAVLTGALIWRTNSLSQYVGYFAASIFAVYVVYILLLTPSESIVRPMLALQVSVLCLSVATFFYLLAQRRASRSDSA